MGPSRRNLAMGPSSRNLAMGPSRRNLAMGPSSRNLSLWSTFRSGLSGRVTRLPKLLVYTREFSALFKFFMLTTSFRFLHIDDIPATGFPLWESDIPNSSVFLTSREFLLLLCWAHKDFLIKILKWAVSFDSCLSTTEFSANGTIVSKILFTSLSNWQICKTLFFPG